MHISQVGVQLIKKHEGLRLKAYLCPGKIWTIGYGHTKTAYAGQIINTRQAESLLQRDLREVESTLEETVRVKLTQNQYDALCSFIFNVGAKAFVESTLLKRLNNKDDQSVTPQLLRWVHANGRPLPGLIRRRQEEAALWLSNDLVANADSETQLSAQAKGGKPMLQSTTAWGATIAGTSASITAFRDGLKPLEEVRTTTTSIADLWNFVLTNPYPILGVICLAACLWVIRERVRHAHEDGI